jgi:hypothetical protein
LPTGTPITARLIQFLDRQMEAVLGTVKSHGAKLPAKFPPMTDYDDPMASAMTPLIGAYWEESGKKAMARLGLDPDEWKVTNPHLKAKIEQAALAFSHSTNATTDLQLDAALAKLRQELAKGLVEEGESIDELTKRVRGIFASAKEHRARRIAATEAARAVHAAQEEAALESGVVAGLEWLVSEDACPLCKQIASEVRMVPLGQDFATIGDNPHYKDVAHPPAHPSCQCAMVEVLKPEYGGPKKPKWGTPLDQPKPPADYQPPEGVPEAKPDKAKHKAPPKPTAPPPSATPEPPPPGPPEPADAFPADVEGLEVVKRLGGSTGAELVRDPATGKLFVRKRGGNPGHLEEELHADALYRALGVAVPESRRYRTAAGPVKLAEYREGTTLGTLKHSDPAAYQAAVAKLRGGFAADALLGNWDVVGQAADNILVTPAGDVLRVDNGGALRYRAQGKPKSSAQWSGTAGELKTLRDPHLNPAAASVFAGLTDHEVADQVEALVKKRAEVLAAAPAELRKALGARLDDMAAWADAVRNPKAPAAIAGWTPRPASEFRPFPKADTQAMEAWGKAQSAEWWESAPKAARDAARAYQGSAYREMNTALRQGMLATASRKKQIEALAKAMEESATTEPVVLVRQLDLKKMGIGPQQLVPGFDILEKGFGSTSLGGNWSGADRLEIRAPAGTKGFYMNAMSEANMASRYPNEREFLLKPGSVFRVVEVVPDGAGRRVVCELVEQRGI